MKAPPKIKNRTYDPAITLVGDTQKPMKAKMQTDTWTSIFIAAFVTIAKRWKPPKYPQQVNG